LNATTVDTQANADAAATALDAAINQVLTARANVGAQMSRFDYRGEMLDTSIENLDAAQSVIMDTDIAAEQTRLTNSEVLTDASVAALSHANQMAERLKQLFQ
jgi:flagellin